jgi:WD40 repeat protein
MRTKGLVLTIILFCIVLAAAALPAPSCDAYDSELIGTVSTEVSGNGNVIAIGETGGTIGTFTPEGSSRWVHRIEEPVTGIAVSGDGRSVAAATLHGELYYFDDEGHLLWNRSGFGCNSRVALSRDGQEGYVFSGSPTHDLTGDTVFHFTGNGSVLSRLPVPGVSSYDLSSDGRVAVVNSGGTHGSNYLVGIDDAGIRWEKLSPRQWHVPLVAVSDDCNTVAAAEPDVLTVFSCHGRELWNTSTKYMARAVAVSGDGQHVAVGTQYQIVYFNRSGTQLWEYPVPDYVGNIKVSQDGTKILTTTRQTLYCLDGDGTNLWQSPLHDWAGSLSMSDDGNVIATGTFNNTFTIFDAKGKATEIDLDTVPVRPVVTFTHEPMGNTSVTPTRSQAAAVSPGIAGIALGILLLLWVSREKS